MYTELERYTAIKHIITLYTEHKEEEMRKYQYLLTHKNRKDIANRPKVNALDLQKVELDLLQALRMIKIMEDIIRRTKALGKAKLKEEMERYFKESPYIDILKYMSYCFAIEHRFPKEIEISIEPEIIGNQIIKIFADKEVLREWKIVYSILLEALPFSEEYKKTAQARQLTR